MIRQSDKEQITAMKRVERERVAYENSRRDCLDLARNSSLTVREIHCSLIEGYGTGAISISAVKRLCRSVR
jgi:hypothetical protein